MDLPPEIPGVTKEAPGSTKHTILGFRCTDIALKLKNIQNTGFFDTFFFNFYHFLQFVPFWGNISAKTQQFVL